MTKLLIVDVQKDFCEGGSLGCEGGYRVAGEIDKLLLSDHGYSEVIASRDWHEHDSSNGGHISDDPDYVDTWPSHCLQDAPGSDYAFVNHGRVDTHVRKGQGVPAYSALEGWTLDNKQWYPNPAEEYHVCGIATDYCVKATVLGLLDTGAEVTVLTGLCAPVTQDGGDAALEEMREAGAKIF
jgi:nicotinamidase/pyrazinamidase